MTGGAEPTTFHVQLGKYVTDSFGERQLQLSKVMTPEQAASLGYDIAAIFKAINTAAVNELNATKSQLTDATNRIEIAESERDAALNQTKAVIEQAGNASLLSKLTFGLLK